MPKVEPRNFDCPETNEPCTNGNCTKQLQIARDKEVVAGQDRKLSAWVLEAIGPSIRRKHGPPR
jgi:hypothetical protein